MINQYPLWKYLLLIGAIFLAILYALPNGFGDDPAIDISVKTTAIMAPDIQDKIKQSLLAHQIPHLSIDPQQENMLVRFSSTDDQLKARDILKTTLGDDYTVALNLAPKTPRWLQMLNAHPMKLGLDLRGGCIFS